MAGLRGVGRGGGGGLGAKAPPQKFRPWVWLGMHCMIKQPRLPSAQTGCMLRRSASTALYYTCLHFSVAVSVQVLVTPCSRVARGPACTTYS